MVFRSQLPESQMKFFRFECDLEKVSSSHRALEFYILKTHLEHFCILDIPPSLFHLELQ